MRSFHNWSTISSKVITGLFGLRKKVQQKPKKYRHSLKVCPYPDCWSVTKNPGEHLRSKKHWVKQDDKSYKKTLKDF